MRIERVVVEAPGGERLDRYLAGVLDLSRTRVANLVEDGQVRVDGAVPKKSDVVEVGQEIEVRIPPPEPLSAEAEDLSLDVVYEDSALLVVNKAAGMVVHPAPGHPKGTLVNALLHHVRDLSGIGGKLRPGIVHRLDRDTSGLMVVAKSDTVHQALSEALKRREIRRLYLAASWGHLTDPSMTVRAPIARDPSGRKRMAVVEGGRPAVTRVRVREQWTAADYLEISLQTGRTHQIRVHLSHVGHPVVGDRVYGGERWKGMSGVGRGWARALAQRVERQFLHAAALAFTHPETGEAMRFRSSLPPDLEEVAGWARNPSGSQQG